MFRNLKVLLGQTLSAAGIHVDRTSCSRAFTEGFHDELAGNIMAVHYHSRDNVMLTPRKDMKITICLLTEWTLKAIRLLKADSMLSVKKGACTVAKYIAFCLEGEIRHAPKCVAYTLVDVWKQTLIT